MNDDVFKIARNTGVITMYTDEATKYVYNSYTIKVEGCFLYWSCKSVNINFDVRPVCTPGSVIYPTVESVYQYELG